MKRRKRGFDWDRLRSLRRSSKGKSYRDFLALLLAEEVAGRKQTRLQRCTRNAHFPFFKTIDEFDFTLQSTLRQSLLGSYLGPDFVTEGRSSILHGKTGRGKTHLAVAIGYRAIQNGFETFFTTAAELIEDLSNASKKGNLQESLATYTHPHVLVIDEVGYLTYGPDAANVLFHVVNDRHLRKRPMIFTTNKPMTEWGKVLHDEDRAAAILDRVLARGRRVQLDGPSGRTRHLNLEESLPADAKRLRISGIGGSEFPEPTPVILRTVVSKLNCHNIHKIVNLVGRTDSIVRWSLLEFSAVGDGYINRKSYEIESDQFQNICTNIKSNFQGGAHIDTHHADARVGTYALITPAGLVYGTGPPAIEGVFPLSGSILDEHLSLIANRLPFSKEKLGETLLAL